MIGFTGSDKPSSGALRLTLTLKPLLAVGLLWASRILMFWGRFHLHLLRTEIITSLQGVAFIFTLDFTLLAPRSFYSCRLSLCCSLIFSCFCWWLSLSWTLVWLLMLSLLVHGTCIIYIMRIYHGLQSANLIQRLYMQIPEFRWGQNSDKEFKSNLAGKWIRSVHNLEGFDGHLNKCSDGYVMPWGAVIKCQR